MAEREPDLNTVARIADADVVAYPNEFVYDKETYGSGLLPELIATATVQPEYYFTPAEEEGVQE